MKRFRSGFRMASLAALSAALLLVGCTKQLLVTSTPPGATAVVTDAEGRVVTTGPTPLLAELNFPDEGGVEYTIEVQPTAVQNERYLPETKRVRTPDYNALPLTADRVPRLAFTLAERDYVSIPVVEVTLSPESEWVGVVAKTRSFKDIAEAGGAVPALVVDFGENRGIQGLALSPDGERIVYSEAVYDRPIVDLSSGSPANTADGTPSAPAAQNQLVYRLKGANLRGINILGGGIQHITTEDFQDMFPSFSPRGDRILFSSNRRGDYLGILGIRANGRSGISDIYVDHRNGMVLKPTSASDGTIAFAVVNVDPASRAVTDTQVWTHYGPNEFPTQITRGREPAISPNGEHIAYINPDDGNLWVIDPDGSDRIQLTSGAAAIKKRFRERMTNTERARFDANAAAGLEEIAPFRYPSWTPDGRYILYTSMEGSDPTGRPNEDIWIMRADGSEKQQLTTNGSADRFPLMSPDGRDIYFLSNRGESWAIWRIAYGPLE